MMFLITCFPSFMIGYDYKVISSHNLSVPILFFKMQVFSLDMYIKTFSVSNY